jgi:hypothetical protein
LVPVPVPVPVLPGAARCRPVPAPLTDRKKRCMSKIFKFK